MGVGKWRPFSTQLGFGRASRQSLEKGKELWAREGVDTPAVENGCFAIGARERIITSFKEFLFCLSFVVVVSFFSQFSKEYFREHFY